ncbi:hypothetical protein [Prescottella agglutinans]|uniref:Diketogulonate reductase-like aldo/keto reductase n=1 Tax=Prescottella agglutinans TaxID=1644129 RepID=A0ABT6ML16_9NOCA|nr:hypothetical protein [Prescottella agglutinans]MDH6284034.1 diketogulonate reductase-like aldo/keto reductase [Prescottella agglutinans]
MTDTLTPTEVVAEFIAQAASIEVHQAMPQAHELVEFLNDNGINLVSEKSLKQGALAAIIASRRGATARINETDNLIADRVRTHLIGGTR